MAAGGEDAQGRRVSGGAGGPVTPSAEQAAAIGRIVEWYRRGPQELYLAGYAGVGKSTVAALAIAELRDKCGVKTVRTAAFTGKAASVMRKKGVEGAQTIHSLIYTCVEDEETGEPRFAFSGESAAADADLIVLDEVSMVNREMAEDVRSYGRKLLIMGDPGQLPPISGEGAFTNREPDIFLREIHRQAWDSPILELATLARQGKPLPVGFAKGDVRVLALTKETQPLIYRPETQPLCGLNRVRWCYAQRIRRLRGFGGELPVPGERLLCRRNDREEGLFNGGLGTLLALEESDGGLLRLDVNMDDSGKESRGLLVDPYLFRRHFTNGDSAKVVRPKGSPPPHEFDWSTPITVHVSQGSSWDDVTVIDDSAACRENRHKHLYTALTRAERALSVLVRP